MFFNLTVFVLACILFMEANGEYVMHQIELHIGAGLALADGGHHQMHCRGVFKVFTTKSLFRPTGIIKTNQHVAFLVSQLEMLGTFLDSVCKVWSTNVLDR